MFLNLIGGKETEKSQAADALEETAMQMHLNHHSEVAMIWSFVNSGLNLYFFYPYVLLNQRNLTFTGVFFPASGVSE